MKLRQLALQNIRHNIRKYIMYFLSLCFSVFTVFAFLGLMNNKSVIYEFKTDARYTSLLLTFGFIIAVFVFFFMLNANNSFIRARKKEISMYSLFGMPNSKIGKLLFMETMIVGMTALIIGIALGIFFSKFTAMILINMTVPEYTGSVEFDISISSIIITSSIFFAFFCILGLSGLRIISKFELVDLFKGDKKSEGNPKGSWIVLVVSLGLIGYGYFLACQSDAYVVINQTLIIIGLVIAGTYLFFHSGLPKILNIIKVRTNSYYKAKNLIAVSSFAHRIRSIGATLATIAVLSAVATTAIATGFTLYSTVEQNSYMFVGYDIRYYGEDDSVIEKVKNIVAENDAEITYTNIIKRYVAYPEIEEINLDSGNYKLSFFGGNDFYLRAYSETEFNSLIENSKTGDEKIDLGDSQKAVYIARNGVENVGSALIGKEVIFGDFKVTVSDYYWCNYTHFGALHAMVFSDDMFDKLLKEGHISNKYKDGNVLDDAVVMNYSKSLNRKMNTEILDALSSTASYRSAYRNYSESMEIYGLIRFIGFFMGAVVILMTASMLYFKQIMAAEEERHLYVMLRKIGMDDDLQKKTILRRLLPVFMVPLAVGILHSIFAMKSADTMIFNLLITGESTYLKVLAFSGAMYLVYVAVYIVFYFITKSQYSRVVKS